MPEILTKHDRRNGPKASDAGSQAYSGVTDVDVVSCCSSASHSPKKPLKDQPLSWLELGIFRDAPALGRNSGDSCCFKYVTQRFVTCCGYLQVLLNFPFASQLAQFQSDLSDSHISFCCQVYYYSLCCCLSARVMTDIQREIREMLHAWKEAPEGSVQEVITKAEYQRLSVLQFESFQLRNASKHVRDDDDRAEAPLKKTRTGAWSEKHCDLDENTVCSVICCACLKEWHLCIVSTAVPLCEIVLAREQSCGLLFKSDSTTPVPPHACPVNCLPCVIIMP